jgi:cobalt-zinc-cadmium efflux system outer membrane protein
MVRWAIGVLVSLAAMCWAQAPATPITVEQALREAIDHNLDLMAERQNVPIARAREITAALRPNPQLTLDLDYTDWLRRGENLVNNAGPPEFASRVDYTLEGGGKRARRIEVAKLATSVAELRLLDTVRQLALSVQTACVDYLQARANLSLARENLSALEETYNLNATKVKAGELAGVELMRTQVAVEQYRNAVMQAELRVKQASTRLQSLLGRQTPDASFELLGSVEAPPAGVLLEDMKTGALADRPDLLALKKDVDRARADTRLQMANGKIDYTLSALYHHQYGYADSNVFGSFLQIPLPVYNRNQGEIARAQRESEQAEIRVRALETGILAEVDSAYQQYMTARNQLSRIKGQMLDQARQVREITQYSYRRGEASLLEFLDAQRAYNDAVQSYNGASADLLRSLYLIDAVTGKPVTP